MNTENLTLRMADGADLFLFKWTSKQVTPKAVVQIAHGMAEHAARYGRFAQALTEAGYIVYANDHRGHGKTADSPDKVGYFGDHDGWHLVMEDMHEITKYIKKAHPGLPVFLFGHSMGSLLSRSYLINYGKDLKGAVLSGTAGDPGLLGAVGMLIAKFECKRIGKKGRSAVMTALSFGSFNNAFKPNRTEFDWLSTDSAEVDKYIADPLCGEVFTAGFFVDLLSGVKEINAKKNIDRVPKNLPIYLFSGAKDPVGEFTKGVTKVHKAFQDAGIQDVTCKFYTDRRHETLNEINRTEVSQDVIAWLNKHC